MTEATEDFVYKSFENNMKQISRCDFNDTKEVKVIKNRKSSCPRVDFKSGECFELKIVSKHRPPSGPSLIWENEKLLNLSEVCDHMEQTGLPAILKVVGGSSFLKLDRCDKIFAFLWGIETRRFFEEYESGKCYTMSCDKRCYREPRPAEFEGHAPVDLSGSTYQSYLDWNQEEKELVARQLKDDVINNLMNKKHGVKYSSKFLIAMSIKDDLLCQSPFLVSEDMGLTFSVAVGVEGCTSEGWTEYCMGHQRSAKQIVKKVMLDQEIKQEKLYLDLLRDNSDVNNSNRKDDVVSLYLDAYFLNESTPQRSYWMTSRSDDSALGQQRQPSSSHVTQYSTRSTSPPKLLPPDRLSRHNQSKRHCPVMGTVAKQALKAPVTPSVPSVNSAPLRAAKDPSSTPTSGCNASLSSTVSSSSSSSSSSLSHQICITNENTVLTRDAVSNEGYFTKPGIAGVPF